MAEHGSGGTEDRMRAIAGWGGVNAFKTGSEEKEKGMRPINVFRFR